VSTAPDVPDSEAAAAFQASNGIANQGDLNDEGPGEFWCATCGARCTRSPTDGTEYGHRYNCDDRPANLPGKGGSS